MYPWLSAGCVICLPGTETLRFWAGSWQCLHGLVLAGAQEVLAAFFDNVMTTAQFGFPAVRYFRLFASTG